MDVAVDWARVRSAFLAGDYPVCRGLLAGTENPEAQLWLAKIEYRLLQLDGMLHRLLSFSTTDTHLSAERDSWIAAGYAMTDELRLAHQLLDRALAVLAPPDEAFFRARYIRAMTFFFAREYEAALQAVAPLLESADPADRAFAYSHRAWVHAKRENLRGQLHDMLLSLVQFDGVAEPDQYILGHTLMSLTALCRELPTNGVYERACAAIPRLADTEGNALANFNVQRHLGLIEILRGHEVSALRRGYVAQQRAPSDYWSVYCFVDRASLHFGMQRKRAALESLDAAHALASRLNWSKTNDSERLILLTIAQLYAQERPALAQRYLAEFRTISTPMHPRTAFVGDRRPRAFELYPKGVALLHLGEREAALEMLEEAYEIFIVFEHDWRASLAALELYLSTRQPRWLERARERIAPWPNSWIAREVRNAG